MPFKSSKIVIAGGEFDRRIKLTSDEREQIISIRESTGLSYAKIAIQFNVSKGLIIMICNPDIAKKKAEQHKQRYKEGRVFQTKERRTQIMREHRQYKNNLHKNGKI